MEPMYLPNPAALEEGRPAEVVSLPFVADSPVRSPAAPPSAVADEGWFVARRFDEALSALQPGSGVTRLAVCCPLRVDQASGISMHLAASGSLERLRLDRCSLGDKHIGPLAQALEANRSLTSLALDENEIGDAGAEDLAEMLRHNTTLRSLGLGSNRVGKRGAIALGQVLDENLHLMKLYLSNQRAATGHDTLRMISSRLEINKGRPGKVLTLSFTAGAAGSDEVRVVCTNLAGVSAAEVRVTPSERMAELRWALAHELGQAKETFRLVLMDGRVIERKDLSRAVSEFL